MLKNMKRALRGLIAILTMGCALNPAFGSGNQCDSLIEKYELSIGCWVNNSVSLILYVENERLWLSEVESGAQERKREMVMNSVEGEIRIKYASPEFRFSTEFLTIAQDDRLEFRDIASGESALYLSLEKGPM